jgi:hypothetical protein
MFGNLYQSDGVFHFLPPCFSDVTHFLLSAPLVPFLFREFSCSQTTKIVAIAQLRSDNWIFYFIIFITINNNQEITGFHYNANKTELNDNEIAITEEIFNTYSVESLSLLKYKYDDVNGIVDNAKLVE